MRQLLSIYFLLLTMHCTLTSFQATLCIVTGNGCGTEASTPRECESSCAPVPFNGSGQNKEQDKNTSCCFVCTPNCCCYLLPTVDMPRWLFPDEISDAPQGLQCWFAQSYQRDIWHPPAAEA